MRNYLNEIRLLIWKSMFIKKQKSLLYVFPTKEEAESFFKNNIQLIKSNLQVYQQD